jgi:glyoxylase-like metal-dependent hydrolase (beta-lactamase superfamily II)
MSANNCNTYLIDSSVRILIDPGHLRFFSHIESGLKELGLGMEDIDLVIATHAHPDHLEAASLFKDTRARFTMHESDWLLVKEMGKYLGASDRIETYPPDFFLTEGDLHIKNVHLQVIHTPGHSPGSLSLYQPAQKALFTGDVLFKDGLGRTDLPGGNGETLKSSIRRLADLDCEWVLPGHGDIISGAQMVRMNFQRVEQMWFAYI